MAGRNFLFVPGPTNTPDRILRAMHVAMEDHRSSTSPRSRRPVLEDLKKIFKTTTGPGVSSSRRAAPARWEASLVEHALARATRCSRPASACSATSGSTWRSGSASRSTCWTPSGARARRSSDTTRRSRADTRPRDQGGAASSTTRPPPASPATSAAVRKALDAAKHPALLMVDGVSSIASIDFRMDEWGVDCAVTGSQKGLMLPAGARASSAPARRRVEQATTGEAAARAS